MDTDLSKYRNYCIINNKKCYTGTILLTSYYRNRKTEFTFICYDTQKDTYVLKEPNGCINFWSRKTMEIYVIAVTEKVNPKAHMPRLIQMSDSDIDGMMLGWMWYIFLMVISILFKDCIGLWVFLTIAFFDWRRKKIKKEGTRIEW